MEHIYLTRRNLLTLLSKLDRKAAGEDTACAIVKNDNKHSKYAQSVDQIMVHAVEDAEYYTDRPPGPMHPDDEPQVKVGTPEFNELVKKLREQTGAPMMECKKAIVGTNGDLVKATEWVNNPIHNYCKLVTRALYKCTACEDTGLVEGMDTYGGSPTFETCHACPSKFPYDERGWEPK